MSVLPEITNEGAQKCFHKYVRPSPSTCKVPKYKYKSNKYKIKMNNDKITNWGAEKCFHKYVSFSRQALTFFQLQSSQLQVQK